MHSIPQNVYDKIDDAAQANGNSVARGVEKTPNVIARIKNAILCLNENWRWQMASEIKFKCHISAEEHKMTRLPGWISSNWAIILGEGRKIHNYRYFSYTHIPERAQRTHAQRANQWNYIQLLLIHAEVVRQQLTARQHFLGIYLLRAPRSYEHELVMNESTHWIDECTYGTHNKMNLYV